MHYVITGGAGFIGSHLADELIKSSDVTIIDNLSTGRVENIKHLIGRPNVIFVRGSITDRRVLREAIPGADGIFHQAAIPSVPKSIEDPLATHEAGITGTLNVLLAAREFEVKKVVYASSSAVYGDTPTLPKREDMASTPLSPYAVTKLCGEYYCKVFSDIYDLPTISLRYFNVYGPRQDPTSDYAAVIPKFITSLLTREPPMIFGDGEQTRDFTYVKDVVDANIRAMESKMRGTYNIAYGEQITINNLATILSDLTEVDVYPIHEPPRPGDIRHSLADISAAKRAFGYEPKYDLRRGLTETLAWYQKY